MNKQIRKFLILFMTLTFINACSSVYYNTMEKMGIHKRDILVSRVEKARDSQMAAKEQFSSALERFKSVVNYDGGDLEEKYEELKGELNDLEARAKDVHQRIEAVEDVAEALFDEWEQELDEYTNPRLRRLSEQKLRQTRRRYNQLIRAMKRAEAKIDPVLSPLRDEVLFLKHNLNARAISSLKGELVRIQTDVSSLVKDMQRAIDESDSFINTMEET